ncbi:MAG: lytic murein transglycosylase [Desulfovibrionaceae bacterium]|nr:lytic murein transglycosylase [Desulfovibrionaceae bacterium]
MLFVSGTATAAPDAATAPQPKATAEIPSPLVPDSAMTEKGWLPLLQRLHDDKIYDQDVGEWFAGLQESYSPRPMGAKVGAMFRNRYQPPPFSFLRRPKIPPSLYPGTLTPENISACRAFLREHADLLLQVEKRYAVPKEVLTALLLVETRLGNFLGQDTAIWTLACLAASNEPETLGELKPPTANDTQEAWLREQLKKKSDRAYNELKALIAHARKYKHNPLEMRGSSEGALGLCQFMPSNINMYGVDGTGNGRIDLFFLPDALHSAANFLKIHGWKNNAARDRRIRTLLRYNHSRLYANTVLTLAEGLAKK